MLLSENEWNAFYEYKVSGGHLSFKEEEELKGFIENKKYLSVAAHLNNGGFFSLPKAIKVNKSSASKKRTVFVFGNEEMLAQKFIAYKLLDYDYIFGDNLYSFRRDMGVKKAIKGFVFHKGIKEMYSFKLDISDYFNSVNAKKLLPELKSVLADNQRLYALIEAMLLEPLAVVDGNPVEVKKGILAGSPLSGFMANLYLNKLDKYFENNGVLYARYSDDIIFFASSKEELDGYKKTVMRFLSENDLTVNDNKVFESKPNEEWTFLGFSFNSGVIDISDISKIKLKKKMRRKARALLRWKIRKNAEPERAVKAYINHFNKKLFNNNANNEITWARWYFPIINTADGLKELDEYSQQCIRYIATGKQNKGKYAFTYDEMKRLGYVTLVNSYYNFKNN